MADIYYNSYLLDSESLQDIDRLIKKGLVHVELEGEKYTDKLSGNKELVEKALTILSSNL